MPPAQTTNEVPHLSDFGIDEADISCARALVHRTDARLGIVVVCCGATVFLAFFGFVYAAERNVAQALVISGLFGMLLAGMVSVVIALVLIPVSRYLLPRYAEAQRVLNRHKQFDDARKAFAREQKRRERAYWLALSPHEFESEVAMIFAKLGVQPRLTPKSGDQGVDIHLADGTSRAIVQCKKYHKPAGPAVVRELYGTLFAHGAEQALLVCTGGFSSGVQEFVLEKPILLVDLDRLLQLQAFANEVNARGHSICLADLKPFAVTNATDTH